MNGKSEERWLALWAFWMIATAGAVWARWAQEQIRR